MRATRLLTALNGDRPAFGTAIHSPDPAITEIIAVAGYDWVSVVLEHAALSLEQLGHLARAADARGITLLVHVADAGDPRIGPLLDEGVGGVVAPHVSSREEAEALIRAARFPPLGERGAAGSVRSADFGAAPYAEYVAHADASVAVGVILETVAGLERLDEILAVPGLTLAFVGLMDLSSALGVPAEFRHPDVRAAIDRVLDAGRRHGVAIGLTEYGYSVAELHELGAGMILTPSSEYTLMRAAFRSRLADAYAGVGAELA